MKHVIHPGLPKTGTTTLQRNIFPCISENLFFAGRYAKSKLGKKILSLIQDMSVGLVDICDARSEYENLIKKILSRNHQ